MRPPMTRLPLPRAAAGAIAGLMIAGGFHEIALFVLLAFVGYLRPGECMRLTPSSVVRPVAGGAAHFMQWGLIVADIEDGVLSKVGVFDEAVSLDMDPWLLGPLSALVSSRTSGQCLWRYPYETIRDEFAKACARLGLQKLEPHIYALRHGGASFDLFAKRRTLEQVKSRGRWRSDASLRRYGKSTRMQQVEGQLDPSVVKFGNHIINNLEQEIVSMMQRGTLTVPLPQPPNLDLPLSKKRKH